MTKAKEKIIMEVLEDENHRAGRMEWDYVLNESGEIIKSYVWIPDRPVYATAEEVQEIKDKIHKMNEELAAEELEKMKEVLWDVQL